MRPITTILTDYHMHSTFSPDGQDSPVELCRQALALGLEEIAITEHAEWHPTMRHKGLPDAAGYFGALESCQTHFGPLGLTVHAGVELGNPHHYPAEVQALLSAYPFQVRLGSLHWLYGENIHDSRCFAGRKPDRVYADYFIELGRMVQNFEFDILAHFDRILLRGSLIGLPFNLAKLETTIRETMRLIAQSSCALELNTTYLALRPGWQAALRTMLTWLYQEGGRRVVINSDAHKAAEIGRHWVLAAEMLAAAGFDIPAHLFRVRAVYQEM